MSDARERNWSGVRYAVDDPVPHALAAGLALQVVVLIITGIMLTPIIVMRGAGIVDESGAWVVFAALLICGITTIIQARPIGRIGAGYVLFMGTSGAYISIGVTAVLDGGLPLLTSLIIVSSLAQFIFASRLAFMRRIITPTVGGTVIMLIAVSVFPVAFGLLTTPGSGTAAAAPQKAAPIAASATFAVIIVVSMFGSQSLRLWAPIMGVAVGYAAGFALGLVDLAPLETVPWIGLPAAHWPGIDLSFDGRFWTLLPAFVMVTVVGAIETYADGIAIQRVSHRGQRAVNFRSVQSAIYADGLGHFLSGVAGTLPNTVYSTSISVVDITGVAARRVAIYGGLILAALAFSPKFATLLLTVPNAVAGAYVAVLLVLLFGHGIRLVMEEGLTYENGLVVGLAFWIGVGFQNKQIFPNHLPDWAQTMFGNAMTSGGLTAIVLMLLLAIRTRTRDRLRVELSIGSIAALHEFVARFATRQGWDKGAIGRLQLVAEEALLFLMDRRDEAKPGRKEVQIAARPVGDDLVELDIVAGAQNANIEDLIARLKDDSAPVEEDVSLRLLRRLAREVRHQQFHGVDCLLMKVDSRPLS